jgi:DnaJ-class molecular chaperone
MSQDKVSEPFYTKKHRKVLDKHEDTINTVVKLTEERDTLQAQVAEIRAALEDCRGICCNNTSITCCPVCGGRGIVIPGFYNVYPDQTGIFMNPETCRTCGGTGIIRDGV